MLPPFLRTACALSLLLATAALARPAGARAERVLVLPVSTADGDDPAPPEPLLRRLSARGLGVLSPARAGERFAELHSKPAVQLAPEQLHKVEAALQALSHNLALERLDQAQEAMRSVEALTPELRDYLNHQVARARELFHACLLVAHLTLKGGGHDAEAFEQVAGCVRSFPGFAPEDSQRYPPDIRALFARAVEHVHADEPSSIRIDSTPRTGCRARLNGIDWGPVPARINDIRARTVRIQVDCGARAGRIHTRRIAPREQAEVLIDSRFDRVVHSEPALSLRYRDAAERDRYLLTDALLLGRTLSVQQVIAVLPDELLRIEVAAARQVAAEPLRTGAAVDLQALLAPPASATGSAEMRDSAEPFGTPLHIAGLTGAALSSAALVVGWLHWDERRGAQKGYLRTGDLAFDRVYNDQEPLVLGFTAAGAVGLSASLAALLPEQDGVPFWSLPIGAAGLTLAGYGVYVWSQRGTSCSDLVPGDDNPCDSVHINDRLGGPFFTLQSLPLLSVPLIYAVRSLLHEETGTAVLRLAPGRGELVLTGRF